MAGATTLSDITLQGNATYSAGSDVETGTATLRFLGRQYSAILLNLTDDTRQEIRNPQKGGRAGPDGLWYSEALHNCWTDASVFLPALSLQAALSDAAMGLVYVGAETNNGVATEHLQLYHTIANGSAGAIAAVEQLSRMDLYLDASSLLPVAVDFNTHPDNDFNASILVEIQFESYQAASGVQIPFRIQKLIQGSLVLDVAVNSASINSGTAASLFTIPATLGPSSGGGR